MLTVVGRAVIMYLKCIFIGNCICSKGTSVLMTNAKSETSIEKIHDYIFPLISI